MIQNTLLAKHKLIRLKMWESWLSFEFEITSILNLDQWGGGELRS